jgi:hypothetical protein
MSVFHVLKVLFAIVLSGAIGWVSLAAFNFVKIWQQFEAFEAAAPKVDADFLASAMDRAITTMQGGSAVFLAAAIAGVLLGEVFKTRSLIFYSGVTGALTAALAATLWETHAQGASPAAAALAMAGFVAGGVYWVIAGPPGSRV